MAAEEGVTEMGNAGGASLRCLARVASVAAGAQFGWAMQFSLLTPYVQELGIPHALAGYIWLCGPISGVVVQPLVGYYSDQCRLRWGRRRPFVLGGALFVVLAVLIISFSADAGAAMGDTMLSRPRAIGLFVVGFWLLDLANNTLQGPCRALLADLAGNDSHKTRLANAFYSFFLSVGNVLGYGAGAYSGWHDVFPFTKTASCDNACANLKSTFLIDVVMLITTTALSLTAANEKPWNPEPLLEADDAATIEDSKVDLKPKRFFGELINTIQHLPKEMRGILIITACTWIAWCPFNLYNTDWMGREVYKGAPKSLDPTATRRYDSGVRVGSFGLMLNSLVLGLSSIVLEPLCLSLKPRRLWACGNLLMFIGFASMVAIGTAMLSFDTPPLALSSAAVAVFGLLGAPLAVTVLLAAI